VPIVVTVAVDKGRRFRLSREIPDILAVCRQKSGADFFGRGVLRAAGKGNA
jgi:hypothetical protein